MGGRNDRHKGEKAGWGYRKRAQQAEATTFMPFAGSLWNPRTTEVPSRECAQPRQEIPHWPGVSQENQQVGPSGSLSPR